jgi:hypothetical protein
MWSRREISGINKFMDIRKIINLVKSRDSTDFVVVKPPHPIPETGHKVFLAGSIAEGKAKFWQNALTEKLSDLPITILNPRRDQWDTDLEQDISNKVFRGQVTWELDGQDDADVIAMYFDPDTEAPITLCELGLYAASGKIICCCPDGFWRKGNVQVVCDRYNIPLAETFDELVKMVRAKLIN